MKDNHQTDQTKLRRLQQRIRARKGMIGCGDEFSVALHTSGKPVYVGTNRWGQEEARTWSDVMSIFSGQDHIVALMEDGTLRIAGRSPVDRRFVSMLSCARAVSTSSTNIAVLLGNGHTVVGGNNRHGQCRTANWPTVTDVVCGKNFTVGLAPTGQVYMVGGHRLMRYAVRAWQNVAGIFTDYRGSDVYGITAEGKLISTARLPRKAEKWRNLVCVAAYRDTIWGVTANGQLVSTEDEVDRLVKTKQYISCALSGTHVLALTRDGHVLSIGQNHFGQCNTERFGCLYADFDEYSSDLRDRMDNMLALDHTYQVRLANAKRYKPRLACGKRITVCINAEGNLLTTSEFSETVSRVRAVACGNAHVLALHEDGHVSADGNRVDGCNEVSEWRGVKAVAAGKYHSVGVTEEGSVLFCGRNDQGQGDVTEWREITRVATSDSYTVGVTHSGKLLIAGAPPFDPTMIDSEWEHPIRIIAAPTHLVCLYADGTVKSTASAMPTEDWQGVRAIAAGRSYTLGLCYGGRVLLAGGSAEDRRRVSEWKNIVDIGCGETYAAGLTVEGRVLLTGELARPGKIAVRATETGRWQEVVAMQCGPRHLVAMTESGHVLSCGEDEDRQCSGTAHFALFRDVRQLYGYGQYSRRLEQEIREHRGVTEEPAVETPRKTSYASSAEASRALRGTFAVGMAHIVTLDEQGNLRTGGANDCGQRDLAVYETAVQVAAGPYRSAVILSDGRIVMAGRNTEGQADTRTLNGELESVSASNRDFSWKAISCGHNHTVALRSDGRVFAVGANPDGRCNTLPWRDAVGVACGIRHTVAVKADGTCVAAGDNHYGQCEVSDWRDVVMIAAGEFHTAALTGDGRVLTVGDRRKGQCATEDLSDIISIACLPEATVCVRSDGRVVIRGGSGELNAAVEALEGIVAVDTCEHRIAAMTADRELILIPS